jgi:hypothetical protein
LKEKELATTCKAFSDKVFVVHGYAERTLERELAHNIKTTGNPSDT